MRSSATTRGPKSRDALKNLFLKFGFLVLLGSRLEDFFIGGRVNVVHNKVLSISQALLGQVVRK